MLFKTKEIQTNSSVNKSLYGIETITYKTQGDVLHQFTRFALKQMSL
jgi:hypothetical protein